MHTEPVEDNIPEAASADYVRRTWAAVAEVEVATLAYVAVGTSQVVDKMAAVEAAAVLVAGACGDTQV